MQDKLILSLRFYEEVATQTATAVLHFMTCCLIYAIPITAGKQCHRFFTFFFIKAMAKKINQNVLGGL